MASRVRRFGKYVLIGVAGLVVLAAAGAVFIYIRVKPTANPPYAVADYSKTANWVCLPGRTDSCAADIDATAIAADGSTTKITPARDPDPKVDCFYVYPTVSRDRTQNARLAMAPEIDFVTRAQFARFSTVCRLCAAVPPKHAAIAESRGARHYRVRRPRPRLWRRA